MLVSVLGRYAWKNAFTCNSVPVNLDFEESKLIIIDRFMLLCYLLPTSSIRVTTVASTSGV